MPTGSATATASATARHVNASVVGMRSMTSPNAGSRWKNDLPKSPRTASVRKRTNCVGSGSVSPSASRSLTRSPSGASGMISVTGSPLAWRIANVTRETPMHTTTNRRRRRIKKTVMELAGSRAHARPLERPSGRARPSSALRLGREEPEPLVGPRLVGDLLRDAERVVLRVQEDRGRLFADDPLDLHVGPLTLGLVDARTGLVDELVETLDARVVLADPAAGLGVIERVQHRVGVKDRVVAPVAVLAVGRLALRLEELVPRRTRVPHLHGGAEPDLGEHLAERLEVRAPVHRGAVQRDVDAVRIARLREQLLGLLGIVWIRLHRGVEAERGRLDDRGHLLAEPRHHLLEHRLLVDRVVRGLAGRLLVERCAPHVERDVVHAQDRRRADGRQWMVLDVVEQVGVDVPDDVDAARLQLGDRGGDLGDGPEDEVLEGGLPAPVAVEGLEADRLVLLPLHELPRAGAHGRGAAERLLADLLDVLLRHDREEDHALEEERERL